MPTATPPLKLAELPPQQEIPAPASRPSRILVIDIGGTKVKALASGETEPRKIRSGKRLTPGQMIEAVKAATSDWKYEAVSIGYPGPVGAHGPRSEPGNLGHGWVGFPYSDAFGMPVRIVNDAAMQALGSYEGGRMLFLGLGTGLGSALIVENTIIPLELGELHHSSDVKLGLALGKNGLDELGKDKWTALVKDVVATFAVAFLADYVVLGGGNAKKVKGLVPGVRLGHNQMAFRGGLRLWNIDYATSLAADGDSAGVQRPPSDWRVV